MSKWVTWFGLALSLVVGLSWLSGQAPPSPIRDPLWSVTVPMARSPLAAEDKLFVLTPQLQALDGTTGKTRWVSDAPAAKLLSIEAGVLYATHETHRLLAIATDTGKLLWETQFAPPDQQLLGSAIGATQGAFIVSVDQGLQVNRNQVAAWTERDRPRWTFLTPPNSQVAANFYEPRDAIRPTVQQGVVILPTLVNPDNDQRSYQIIALSAATGAVQWTWQTESDFLDSVAVRGDTVYPVYLDRQADASRSWVKALDLQTGQERWSYPVVGVTVLASDREVYLWNDRGPEPLLQVLDRHTGQLRRVVKLALDYPRDTGFALQGETLFATDMEIKNVVPGFYGRADNHMWIRAFDAATGELRWRTPTLPNSHLEPPLVQGDRLLVVSRPLEPKQSAVIQAFAIAPPPPPSQT